MWNFRLAEPRDADAFSKWAAENPQIDPRDLVAGMGKTNPTVVIFVAEKDGVAMAFAPVFLSAVIAHLGFNPDARAAEKLQALDILTNGAMAFLVQYGIREMTTLSKPEYGVAQWASKHGFEKEERSLFRLDFNREMAGVV